MKLLFAFSAIVLLITSAFIKVTKPDSLGTPVVDTAMQILRDHAVCQQPIYERMTLMGGTLAGPAFYDIDYRCPGQPTHRALLWPFQ